MGLLLLLLVPSCDCGLVRATEKNSPALQLAMLSSISVSRSSDLASVSVGIVPSGWEACRRLQPANIWSFCDAIVTGDVARKQSRNRRSALQCRATSHHSTRYVRNRALGLAFSKRPFPNNSAAKSEAHGHRQRKNNAKPTYGLVWDAARGR